MKAADENGYCSCVTCGETKQWNDGMQGGHFIDRGHNLTRIMEENIHPQCAYCNGPCSNRGMVMGRYTIYMQDMYGHKFVADLLDTKGKSKKFTRHELDDIAQDLRFQIKIEGERLGIC